MPNATIAQYPIEYPDLLVSNLLARLKMKSIVVEHRRTPTSASISTLFI